MRADDPRLAREPVRPAILPGLPGGAVYVSEAELEQHAMVVFESVAMMHPGMEQRRITADRLGLHVRPPRAQVESGLIEVHGDVSFERLREFGIRGV